MRLLLLLVASSLFAAPFAAPASAQQPRPVTDEFLSQRMVGKWQVEYFDEKTKRKSIGWTVYNDRGLAASRSLTKVGDEVQNIVLQARWRIENGVLITTITKSSHPDVVKVASVTRDRLTVLTEKRMQYIDQDGKTINEIRVPDDKPAETK